MRSLTPQSTRAAARLPIGATRHSHLHGPICGAAAQAPSSTFTHPTSTPNYLHHHVQLTSLSTKFLGYRIDMRIQRSILGLRHVSVFTTRIGRSLSRRPLVTLAIETSCDDTSVAILEKNSKFGTEKSRALLHFHRKITANNAIHKGVHPLVALQSHQQNLANLVQEALHYLPPEEQSLGAHTVAFPARDGANGVWSRRRPDFISVTRGPGMRSNLSTGLDIAKGLAVAWQVLQQSSSVVNKLTCASG